MNVHCPRLPLAHRTTSGAATATRTYFFCSSLHKPLTAQLSPQGDLTVCDPCKVNTKVFASGRPIAGSPVLGYGHANEIGNVRCRSETTGITCTLISGAEKERVHDQRRRYPARPLISAER